MREPEPDAKRQKTISSGVLQLEGRNLGDDGLKKYLDEERCKLEQLISENSSVLEFVNVSGNNLSDDGVETLVDFLQAQEKPLKRLDVRNNRLTEPLALCQILREGTCGLSSSQGLRQLALTGNPITDVGFISIFDEMYQLKVNSGGTLRPPFEIEVDKNAPAGEASAEDREGMFETIAEMGITICVIKPGVKRDNEADIILKLL